MQELSEGVANEWKIILGRIHESRLREAKVEVPYKVTKGGRAKMAM